MALTQYTEGDVVISTDKIITSTWTNNTNNLLSAIVAIYPLGSAKLFNPLKFKGVGLITVDAPKESVILGTLAVTIASFEVPRGNVINLCLMILVSSGMASIKGIFSIASPEYWEPLGWFSLNKV